MKTKTFVMASAVTALASLVPSMSHAQTPANPDAPVPIVLTRATNQLIDAENNVRTVTVWSDYTLQPGEAFSVCVQRGAEPLLPKPASLYVHWQPDHTGTASSFSWFFGGSLGKDFGEPEADAALAQIKERFADRTLTLAPGTPQPLFSVRNQDGIILNGFIEFNRTAPVPAETVQAVVQFRASPAINPNAPSMGYSATVPAGYALRATANTGFADTLSPAGPDQYHSSWLNLPTPRPITVTPGQRPQMPAPPKPHSVEEMATQRNVLQTQLQELQEHGPIQVTLGTPKLIFSITNASGEVFQGFLELVGPGTQTAQATTTETIQLANEHLVLFAAQPQEQMKRILPAAGTIAEQPSTALDPATGLPQVKSTAAH